MKICKLKGIVMILLFLGGCSSMKTENVTPVAKNDCFNGIIFCEAPVKHDDKQYGITVYTNEPNNAQTINIPVQMHLLRFLYSSTMGTVIGFFDTDEEDELAEIWTYQLAKKPSSWVLLETRVSKSIVSNVTLYGDSTLSIPSNDGLYLVDLLTDTAVQEIVMDDILLNGSWSSTSHTFVYYGNNGLNILDSKGKLALSRANSGIFQNICIINDDEIIFSRDGLLMKYQFSTDYEEQIASVEGTIYLLALSNNEKEVAVYYETEGLVGRKSQSLKIVNIETGELCSVFSQPFQNSISSLVWSQ